MTVGLDWYRAEDIDSVFIPMERARNNCAQSVDNGRREEDKGITR